MPNARAPLQAARELLAKGDAQAAYRELTSLFSSGPDPLAESGLLPAAIGVLADVARSFGDAALAGKLDACCAAPDDPRALYDVAYGLYEQRQFAAGAALLYRANALAPGQRAIVTELAGCLEHQLRYGEAALVVDLSGLATADPLCAYLSGFSHVMAGDLDAPRERVRVLASATDSNLVFMREALEGILSRADAVLGAGIALDDRALSAWQAVVSGTALLHSSPHGYPDPMRGRYAYVSDSPGLEREGLERLKAVLAARSALPERVVAAPGRASRILAAAASRLFGVPRADWSASDTAPGLFVVWSMEEIEDRSFLQGLHDHRAGQTLFVHASSWTEPFAYAPDVTTFLHQSVANPWTGGAMRFDQDTKQVVRAPPDERSDDEIVAEILAAPPSDPSTTSVAEVLAIVRALDGAPAARRGGLARTSGKRLHQRAGGPVPSNRFL
jgi:hypothetical protein